MLLREFFASDQPRLSGKRIVLAGSGVSLSVAMLGLLGDSMGAMLLFVGLAPTCLLVFTLPEAPVSQPSAVIGGQLIAAAVGVGAGMLLPVAWWSIAIATGVAVVCMAVLRVLHPPAVANTVIACSTGAGWMFLLTPVLAGSVLIVVIAVVWHRFTRRQYPLITRLR